MTTRTPINYVDTFLVHDDETGEAHIEYGVNNAHEPSRFYRVALVRAALVAEPAEVS